MKDYEIYEDDKLVGVVKINWSLIDSDLDKSLLEENSGQYKILNENEDIQLYTLTFLINNIDDIYDIVSKYKFNEKLIFEEIDKIKELNNIKNVKKEEKIIINIPEIYLKYFNVTKDNVSKKSLIENKIYFIDKSLVEDQIKIKNNVINDINNIINSKEYSFMTDEEKDNLFNKTLDKLDNISKTANINGGAMNIVNLLLFAEKIKSQYIDLEEAYNLITKNAEVKLMNMK